MRLARPILISALAMIWGGAVSAAPEAIVFSLISSFGSGGAFPSTSTYIPPLPLEGSGTIDEVAGTYDFTIPDFSIETDILPAPPDAQIDISGWGQVGTFTGAGAMTSSTATGTVACTDLGTPFGPFICAVINPVVVAWPPTGASGFFGAPGATIDVGTNTIVITEAHDVNGGQIRTIYTYALPPNPVPALSARGMMALGLLVLTAGTVAILRRENSPAA